MTSFLDKLNLKPQERRIVIFVAAIVFVVFNIWIVGPVFGELGRTQQRIRDTRRTLVEYGQTVAQAPSYQKELDTLSRMGVYIPSQEQGGDLMRDVQNQARLSGVNVSRWDPSQRRSTLQTNEFFDEKTLVVTMTSTGEREIIDFLFRLSSQESLTRVRSMNISPDPSRQKLSGSITLVRSYQRKPIARPASM